MTKAEIEVEKLKIMLDKVDSASAPDDVKHLEGMSMEIINIFETHECLPSAAMATLALTTLLVIRATAWSKESREAMANVFIDFLLSQIAAAPSD